MGNKPSSKAAELRRKRDSTNYLLVVGCPNSGKKTLFTALKPEEANVTDILRQNTITSARQYISSLRSRHITFEEQIEASMNLIETATDPKQVFKAIEEWWSHLQVQSQFEQYHPHDMTPTMLFSNATEMMRDDWKEDGYLRLFAKQPPLTALRCLKLTETDIDVELMLYPNMTTLPKPSGVDLLGVVFCFNVSVFDEVDEAGRNLFQKQLDIFVEIAQKERWATKMVHCGIFLTHCDRLHSKLKAGVSFTHHFPQCKSNEVDVVTQWIENELKQTWDVERIQKYANPTQLQSMLQGYTVKQYGFVDVCWVEWVRCQRDLCTMVRGWVLSNALEDDLPDI